MYKNLYEDFGIFLELKVSILVLMDLCIKTKEELEQKLQEYSCFNPCFNGSMYKNFC